MPVVYYPAIVEAGDEPGFGVFFPDLDGCTSAGDTLQEAARNAEQALDLHLRGMIEDGLPVPAPRALDAIAPDPEVREAARILVRAELPDRAVRLDSSLDESLVDAMPRRPAA